MMTHARTDTHTHGQDRTSATNHFNRPFQALSKNVFIRADIVLSALETFCSIGYISLLIYLLTLLTGCKQNDSSS